MGGSTALDSLAARWNGGRASRLYAAGGNHWKTRFTERALEKLGLAAASDVKLEGVRGLALVTGLDGVGK
jgi:hypothetical protein